MKNTFEKSPHSFKNKAKRFIWRIIQSTLFRRSPERAFGFRRGLLRIFGAKIGDRAIIYPDVVIWAPWNLIMGVDSCLSRGVDCYCQGYIILGDCAVVSQRSFLCGATHDYRFFSLPLVVKDIKLGSNCWICAEAFIGPGVDVGMGAVVGARSVVLKDVPAMAIVGGNPAKIVGERVLGI